MSVGRYILCLHTHMPYVLGHGTWPHGTDWLYESVAESYLPLLEVLYRLEQRAIKPKWTINITPILADQLASDFFREDFVRYCKIKIEGASLDQAKFAQEGPLWLEGIARHWQRAYAQAIEHFVDLWNRDILGAFRRYQDEGYIEMITCAATHAYLPLLSRDESIHAQIKLATQTHEKHFGKRPAGIWLPECAYRPSYAWKPPVGELTELKTRKSIDRILIENNIEYFFIDSHMIGASSPIGTYLGLYPELAEYYARSEKQSLTPPEKRSEYEYYKLPSGATCFVRDPETTTKVWSSVGGYPGDEYYLEFHKKLHPGMHRYWRISENKADLGAKQPYDPWEAFDRIRKHAFDYVELISGTLGKYKGRTEKEGTLVSMYDTELFGHWWWEGTEFLFDVALQIHNHSMVQAKTGKEIIENSPAKETITLPEGSWGEGGHHQVWFNKETLWTWEKLYAAEKRFFELLEIIRKPAAQKILSHASRELLLAQSSDWQFLITTWAARDYAEKRFSNHIKLFHQWCDYTEKIERGDSLSEEETQNFESYIEKIKPFSSIDLKLWEPSPQTTLHSAS